VFFNDLIFKLIILLTNQGMMIFYQLPILPSHSRVLSKHHTQAFLMTFIYSHLSRADLRNFERNEKHH